MVESGHLISKDRDNISNFYTQRLNKKGSSVETVGWSSVETQKMRFDVLTRNLDLKGKRILDVGCGLGDMIAWLEQKTDGSFDYVGIDICEGFIDYSRKKFSDKYAFLLGDIFQKDLGKFDHILCSGTFSYKTSNNIQYAKLAIKKMIDLSENSVCVNFLSTYVDYQLEHNFHYDPIDMFSFAKDLSRWVTIYHDYPLWEFTLQLRQQPHFR